MPSHIGWMFAGSCLTVKAIKISRAIASHGWLKNDKIHVLNNSWSGYRNIFFIKEEGSLLVFAR